MKNLNLKSDSGLAFVNRTDNEKAPKFKGQIMVGSKRYEVAVWVRETSRGEEMLCFNLQDCVAQELARHEAAMDKLQNTSEAEK